MAENGITGMRKFFRGASCAVDAQGRLTFPKIWRLPTDDENTMFMLSPGLSRSISVHPMERFNDILDRALTAPKTAEAQNYLSIYASHCQPITLDKQGRFQVSEQLLRYAGISGKAEYVGALTYGRIFCPERWEQIRLYNDPGSEVMAEESKVTGLSGEEREFVSIRRAIEFIGTL